MNKVWIKKLIREYKAPYPEYIKARKKGLIETGILPLTNTLYSLGFYLIASCEGHIERSEKSIFRRSVRTIPFQPYVYFECANLNGKKLSNTVNDLKDKLNFQWNVKHHNDERWSIKAKAKNFVELQRALLEQDISLISSTLKKHWSKA